MNHTPNVFAMYFDTFGMMAALVPNNLMCQCDMGKLLEANLMKTIIAGKTV